MCTCFADGLAKSPPFPDDVELDGCGFLTLGFPHEDDQDKHRLFDQWLNTACMHPDMEYASEFVSNWSGYRSFQQALAATGGCWFPTLIGELPEGSGGLTSAAAAAKMLEELTSFIEWDNLGWKTVLVDTDTGQELQEYIEAYDGIFHLGADGIDMGVDERGFFIRRRHGDRYRELFRSRRLQQSLLDGGLRKLLRKPAIEFLDLESGQKFRCHQRVFHIAPWPDGRMQDDEGELCVSYPARLHVTRRERRALEFEYIVLPLRRLCQAAVETGNPIRWH
jgi:hypothetical protein